MMIKFREWMKGKGRPAVILLVVSLALLIVVDFYQNKNTYLSSDRPNPTVAPESREDYIGGDRMAPASAEPSPEGESPAPDPASSAEPGRSVTPGPVSSAPSEKMPSPAPAGSAASQAEGGGEDATVRLGFAGDICLDDSCAVMRHMRQKGGLDQVVSPGLIEKMNRYDAMVINNEFSVSRRGSKMPGKAFTFRSRPANVRYLRQLGVDVAGLANNHVFDYGETAFLDTLRHLKKAGIKTMGAGADISEARKPVYLTIKGKTIAIVAATRAEKMILTPAAGKRSPGVFRTYDDTQYVREIRRAKKRADYVIAYVHWGTEYSVSLEDAQREQAKDYIKAGADAVVGAHTHCLQGIGFYRGAPILYSLGNFWFNERTLYTTVLEIAIDSGGKLRAAMVPCLQKGKETRMLRKKSQVKKFIRYVNEISAGGKLDGACRVVEK